ncbi:hypothetical protein, partial [Neptunomonas phycophila]
QLAPFTGSDLASNQSAGQDLKWIKKVQSGSDYNQLAPVTGAELAADQTAGQDLQWIKGIQQAVTA